MAMKLYSDTAIQDIADAIRSKNGSSDTYTVSEMAQAIEDIPSGSGGDISSEAWAGTEISGDLLLEPATIARACVFYGCTGITSIKSNTLQSMQASAFAYCSSLSTIVLGHNGVVALANANAIGNTPFKSGGTGGTLYVPQALISSYQSATNWSTYLGYENNQILPIEGSVYESV